MAVTETGRRRKGSDDALTDQLLEAQAAASECVLACAKVAENCATALAIVFLLAGLLLTLPLALLYTGFPRRCPACKRPLRFKLLSDSSAGTHCAACSVLESLTKSIAVECIASFKPVEPSSIVGWFVLARYWIRIIQGIAPTSYRRLSWNAHLKFWWEG